MDPRTKNEPVNKASTKTPVKPQEEKLNPNKLVYPISYRDPYYRVPTGDPFEMSQKETQEKYGRNLFFFSDALVKFQKKECKKPFDPQYVPTNEEEALKLYFGIEPSFPFELIKMKSP